MRRVRMSRHRVAGVLRRPPLLDSVVTVPNGPAEHAADEFRLILEMAGAGTLADDEDDGRDAEH